jgi:hypothetical protein
LLKVHRWLVAHFLVLFWNLSLYDIWIVVVYFWVDIVRLKKWILIFIWGVVFIWSYVILRLILFLNVVHWFSWLVLRDLWNFEKSARAVIGDPLLRVVWQEVVVDGVHCLMIIFTFT